MQKHYICIDVIIQLVKSSNNSDVNKIFALSTFPLQIFDYFNQLEKEEVNETVESETEPEVETEETTEDEDEDESLDSFNEIVNELYQSICDVIKMKNKTEHNFT